MICPLTYEHVANGRVRGYYLRATVTGPHCEAFLHSDFLRTMGHEQLR